MVFGSVGNFTRFIYESMKLLVLHLPRLEIGFRFEDQHDLHAGLSWC